MGRHQRRLLLALLGSLALAVAPAPAQTLMMRFGFQDTGNTTTDSVAGVVLGLTNSAGLGQDFHGAIGSGIGGVGKALDFSSAGANNNANPLAATVGNTAVNFGTVGAFTVTMWVKPEGAIEYARFFGLGPNGTTDTGQANEDSFQGNNANTSCQAEVNGTGVTTGTGINIVNNQWNFIAYTYDGSSTITIYTADLSTPVASGGSVTAANAGGSVNIGSSFSLMIGNRISNRQRGFPAYFGDVRYYTGAATPDFLETVRNSAVPNPFTSATVISPSMAPVGADVILSAPSGGTGSISYQWYQTVNNVPVPVPGATSPTYVLQNVQLSAAGSYSLVVSDGAGSVTNAPAALTVVPLAGAGVNIVDYGPANPVPGLFDLSQLSTNSMSSAGNGEDGLNYFADNSVPPGQTFTTGSNPAGYIINGLYLKTAGLNGSGTGTAQNYTVRLYSVSGSTATLISTYVTANQLGFADGDWILYTGGFTNVLQPNTTYAYTHHRNSTGWDLLGYNNSGTDAYPGGYMCLIPPAGGAITFGGSGMDDAAFDLSLSTTPTTPVILQQPASQTVVVGQPTTLTVGVIDAVTPSYKWYLSSDTNYSNPTLIPGATSASYRLASPTLHDGTNYFVVVSGGGLAVTSTVAALTVRTSVNSLAWLGTNSFNWDLTSPNWSNTVAPAGGFVYQTGDNVSFTDAGKSSSPISLATALAPSSVTVSSASNYIFAGTGSLVGNVQLTKTGNGTLIISNANTFSGTVAINNGVLQMANVSALGNSTNTVSVNGGTLDFGGIAAPAILGYTIQGAGYTNAGALNNFNNNNIQNGNGILGLILAGDATIGANNGRWDLNGDGGGALLQGNGHNLTKVGPATVFFVDSGTNCQLGNITILNGTLGFQGNDDLGLTNDTIYTLGNGSSLAFYAIANGGLGATGAGLAKSLVFSNAFFSNAGNSLTLNGAITLLGTNTQSAGYQENSGLVNTFNGPISGSGGWIINSVEQDSFYGTNTYTGPTVINSAEFLVIGPNSSLNSSSQIALNNSSAIIDLTQTPGLMRGAGQTLSGIGMIYGEVTNNPGSTIAPGVGGPGTLSMSEDLTLSGATLSAYLSSDPTQIGNAVNSLVSVGGNLNLSGVTTIQITPAGPLSTSQPYTILTYGGALTGGAANLRVVSSNPRYTVSVVNPATTPNVIEVSISGVAEPLVWKGGQSPSPNVWSHSVTNFLNTVTLAYDRFYDGDLVSFDDTAVTNIINVTDTNAPGLMTLNNNTIAYTFMGGGNISGTLDKEGNGIDTFALSNSLALNFITNNAGMLVLNPLANGTLAATVSDNGQGQGSLVKSGTNLLVLSGNNTSYNGAIVVTNGTLQYTALSALGNNGTVYATNSGSLDINNLDTGSETIDIAGPGFAGEGALVDVTTTWPAYPYQIVHNVTLLGNATIGANNRWDEAGGTLNGNDFDLTKVGGGQISLVNLGATSLGNITINGGNLTFQQGTDMGDPAKSLVVQSNAVLGLWAGTQAWVKTNTTLINATINSGGSSNALLGQITLLPGTNYISTSVDLSFWGPIVGAGGFIKQGGGTVWLYGTNTYSGPTTIGQNSTVWVGAGSSLGASSTIEVDGGSILDVSTPTLFTFGAGQTLIGNGTVAAGNVLFATGSTLAVGFSGATSTLTMNGSLTLLPGSTNLVTINKTVNVASVPSDQVTGLGSVSIGGTLVLTNLGSALAAGDTIPLFTAASYTGSFARIIPATPGPGLLWDTTKLATTGALGVASGVNLTPTNLLTHLSGNQLTLAWPADHTGWSLQSQTNSLGSGLGTNWVNVAGANSTNQVIITIVPGTGAVFFRMVYP